MLHVVVLSASATVIKICEVRIAHSTRVAHMKAKNIILKGLQRIISSTAETQGLQKTCWGSTDGLGKSYTICERDSYLHCKSFPCHSKFFVLLCEE